MEYYPVYLSLREKRVLVVGTGECALAKLRLLMKTPARIEVYGVDPIDELVTLSQAGRIHLMHRDLSHHDLNGAELVYAAQDDDALDSKVANQAREHGVLVNVVDNLRNSDFITPAIVDRSPVTIAIGTEGAAPILARQIKAHLEEFLPNSLGRLTQIAQKFRPNAAALPYGRPRRAFWSEYFQKKGPQAFDQDGETGAQNALEGLLDKHLNNKRGDGFVSFVGAGPGDPELLTLKARTLLHQADVVIYDRLVGLSILELARREAQLIDVGKTGFGPSTPQAHINKLIVEHTTAGAHVVRLKGGDCTVFGRLDEEIDALDAHGLSWHIVPGITAASAAVAALGHSMTKRGRNASVRFLTGHDMKGFADQDWESLAKPNEVAAIYMGKKSARFVQGRLLMFGASPQTQISIVENASRCDMRIFETSLGELVQTLHSNDVSGPALIFYGLAPRQAQSQTHPQNMEFA